MLSKLKTVDHIINHLSGYKFIFSSPKFKQDIIRIHSKGELERALLVLSFVQNRDHDAMLSLFSYILNTEEYHIINKERTIEDFYIKNQFKHKEDILYILNLKNQPLGINSFSERGNLIKVINCLYSLISTQNTLLYGEDDYFTEAFNSTTDEHFFEIIRKEITKTFESKIQIQMLDNITLMDDIQNWQDGLIILDNNSIIEINTFGSRSNTSEKSAMLDRLSLLIQKNKFITLDSFSYRVELKESNRLELLHSTSLTSEIKHNNGSLFDEELTDYSFSITKHLKLSNTAIKDYLSNPYFFYIKRICDIKPKFIQEDLSTKKGKVIHKICENFAIFCQNKSNNINLDSFLKIAKPILTDNNIDPENPFWLHYLNAISNKLITIESRTRLSGRKIEVERKNLPHLQINSICSLIAIPDRIEYLNLNEVILFDFKTGTVAKADEMSGKNPQFSIISMILREIGINVIQATYVSLNLSNMQDVVFSKEEIQQTTDNAILNIKEIANSIAEAKSIDNFPYKRQSSFMEFADQKAMQYFARKKVVY